MTHPAASVILELRQLLKTRDTFLKGHVLGHNVNGVVYPNFNQTRGDNGRGTISGRISCNEPALQQIQKRNEKVASIVRSLFLPDRDQDWVCRDYSQMDFRIFAHYAKSPPVLAAYKENSDSDFHQVVADMMNVSRKEAKSINLGLCFGMREGRLAKELDLPYAIEIDSDGRERLKPGDEAKTLFSAYHKAIPGAGEVLSRASSVGRSRGFVKTILGRRVRFPNPALAYKAGALIFQGSAADALKVKLVEIHKILKSTDGRILLSVHDEINTSLPKGKEGEALSEAIRESMECFDGVHCPIKFRVPIRSSVGIGPNWWEASK
jgi:DNA polymerase-1